MYEGWKRQTMEKHSLTNVRLTDASAQTLSETVKQYAEAQVAGGRTQLVLPQIKYQFPAIPKKKVGRFIPFLASSTVLKCLLDRVP